MSVPSPSIMAMLSSSDVADDFLNALFIILAKASETKYTIFEAFMGVRT
jgi:hypothetical protein